MKLSVSWQQTVVLVAAMVFIFAWVKTGLGDVKAAITAVSSGAVALWALFQSPPSAP
jgi:hypothetical protein